MTQADVNQDRAAIRLAFTAGLHINTQIISKLNELIKAVDPNAPTILDSYSAGAGLIIGVPFANPQNFDITVRQQLLLGCNTLCSLRSELLGLLQFLCRLELCANAAHFASHKALHGCRNRGSQVPQQDTATT